MLNCVFVCCVKKHYPSGGGGVVSAFFYGVMTLPGEAVDSDFNVVWF
jgi:hypothetical protein